MILWVNFWEWTVESTFYLKKEEKGGNWAQLGNLFFFFRLTRSVNIDGLFHGVFTGHLGRSARVAAVVIDPIGIWRGSWGSGTREVCLFLVESEPWSSCSAMAIMAGLVKHPSDVTWCISLSMVLLSIYLILGTSVGYRIDNSFGSPNTYVFHVVCWALRDWHRQGIRRPLSTVAMPQLFGREGRPARAERVWEIPTERFQQSTGEMPLVNIFRTGKTNQQTKFGHFQFV